MRNHNPRVGGSSPSSAIRVFSPDTYRGPGNSPLLYRRSRAFITTRDFFCALCATLYGRLHPQFVPSFHPLSDPLQQQHDLLLDPLPPAKRLAHAASSGLMRDQGLIRTLRPGVSIKSVKLCAER